MRFERKRSRVYERRRHFMGKHLQSAISANPTLGDVDGDHFLEVVVGTHSGAIHVLSAETGEEKYPFHFIRVVES